jgi:tyrosinase
MSLARPANPIITAARRSLTIDERKDYIRAVKCLISSPPKTQTLASAVQNRYEDFVAMHINTTLGG